MRPFQLLGISCFCAATLAAQSSPVVATSKAMSDIVKNNILRSADKVSEDLWSFKPTPEVRSMGQIFAHIANAQYEFCSAPQGDKPVDKKIEETAKTKAEIVSALKEAFAYCDAAYSKLTADSAVETVSFFGSKMTRIGIMDFNVVHSSEHYGNLVTYMRLKQIVPPSSEPRK